MHLVNSELIDREVIHKYESLDDNFQYGAFCGYVIKNQYDEQRFTLCDKQAKRIKFTTSNSTYNLYGLLNEKPKNNLVFKQLLHTPPVNIGAYSSLLSLNRLSCVESFLYFDPGLYPIDINHVNRFFTSLTLNTFEGDSQIPFFQRVGGIYLFALVKNKKIK